MLRNNVPKVEAPSRSDWQPSASLDAVRLRAEILARARRYFDENGVIEVETPILATATNPDPNIPSFKTAITHPGESAQYLNTSPEFAMKRLLASGSGSIYQICKAFRQGELGRFHNPEFTLLEWYRLDFDHIRLMDDVTDLVMSLIKGYRELEAEERVTYRECFVQHLQLDPHFATISELKSCAEEQNLTEMSSLGDDRDGWLDLLMSHCIQPKLGQNHLTFIYDYPASQAALARISPGSPPVAERFELFLDGTELANGFHELQDANQQRDRFMSELQRRKAIGLEQVPVDETLLAALESGLPDCAGVALGLDRLLLLLSAGRALEEVITFKYKG